MASFGLDLCGGDEGIDWEEFGRWTNLGWEVCACFTCNQVGGGMWLREGMS